MVCHRSEEDMIEPMRQRNGIARDCDEAWPLLPQIKYLSDKYGQRATHPSDLEKGLE